MGLIALIVFDLVFLLRATSSSVRYFLKTLMFVNKLFLLERNISDQRLFELDDILE